MPKRKMQLVADSLSTYIKKFIRKCQVKNLSERTIEHYQASLDRFLAFVGDKPITQITESDLEDFTLSGKDLSTGTVNGWLRDLRAFFNYAGIPLKIEFIKGPQKQIVPFDEKQIKLLLKQPNTKTFSGIRDYTLMVLLFDTGIRIQEALELRKIDITGNQIFIRNGKGRKERFVPIGDACSNALQSYLIAVDDIPNDKPIFVTVNNNQMDRHRCWQRFKIYADKAGIQGVRPSPHTFRHTFAKMYLLNGGDMFSLQKILGHTSLDMVRRYVNLFTCDLAEQHKKYSPFDSLKGRRRKC